MKDYLGTKRRQLETDLSARRLAHTFSLSRYQLYREVSGLIERYAGGRCLDVGAGRSPFDELLRAKCENVVRVDVEDRSGRVDLMADVQSMPQVADASYETILCTQVLEHVPRPWDAVAEMARVLRPDGHLILSVPHLSAIHEAPHDYYRYTSSGLEALCCHAGLEVTEVVPAGGLLSFLLHGPSYVMMSTVGSLAWLRWPAWGANYFVLVRLAEPLDRLLGLRAIYPCNLAAVFTKPEPRDRNACRD